MRGLPFRIGGDLYALRLSDVSEVLPFASLRQVPGMGAAVAGLLNLRGHPVPIVDLAVHCVGRSEPADVRTRLVMLAPAADEAGPGTDPVGLVLGTTGDIVDVSVNAIRPSPLSTPTLPFLAGMSAWRGATLQWLSLPALRTTVAHILRAGEPGHA